VLSMVSLFADIASEMLYPVVPVYLRSIGFSVFLIGLLEGIAEATAGLSKGYFGNWSDNQGKRLPFVRWGYLLSALAKPMMVLLKFPLWIFFARTTDRIGKGLRTAPRDALLSDEATIATKAAVFSFHRGMDSFGAFIGPLIALTFLHFYPEKITTLFIIAFIPGILSVGLTFLIKEKVRPQKESKKLPGLFTFLKYWKTAAKDYKRLLIPLLFFALFNSSDMLLLLKVKEATGSDHTAIMVYIFFNLTYAIFSYPLGLLADKLNMKLIFLIGLLLFSVTYFGMAYASSTIVFFILFGVYGIFMASTEGISKAWISNLIPKEETGTGIGLFVSLQSIALMLASTFAGLVWSIFRAKAAFHMTSFARLAVLLFMFIYVSMSPKK
ncbi:MAG: MFS transporter, partial [Bacteroidales bacterium]|nr:MFS transporter [Bacteroidales bacterium]